MKEIRLKPLHHVTDPSRKPERSASTGLEHRLDGPKQNHEIQPGAEVLQVIEIIRELEI